MGTQVIGGDLPQRLVAAGPAGQRSLEDTQVALDRGAAARAGRARAQALEGLGVPDQAVTAVVALLEGPAWVAHTYRLMYGGLAALLPSCWADHAFRFMTLDWLSELWQVLYVRASRTPGILVSQAECQTRLLPAAADHASQAAVGCTHRQAVAR